VGCHFAFCCTDGIPEWSSSSRLHLENTLLDGNQVGVKGGKLSCWIRTTPTSKTVNGNLVLYPLAIGTERTQAGLTGLFSLFDFWYRSTSVIVHAARKIEEE
jgi:hypothetical protein